MNEFLAENTDLAIRLAGTLCVLAATLILSAVGRRLALATFDEQERPYKASKWFSRVLWLRASS